MKLSMKRLMAITALHIRTLQYSNIRLFHGMRSLQMLIAILILRLYIVTSHVYQDSSWLMSACTVFESDKLKNKMSQVGKGYEHQVYIAHYLYLRTCYHFLFYPLQSMAYDIKEPVIICHRPLVSVQFSTIEGC